MRIALFSEVFLPKIDGITNRLAHSVRCLVEQGHEVLVFAPETAVAEHAGARVVRVPGPVFPPYPELRVTAPDPRIAWELCEPITQAVTKQRAIAADYQKFMTEARLVNGIENEAVMPAEDDWIVCRM